MAIFNRTENMNIYREIIRIIKSSNLYDGYKIRLIEYVDNIKNGSIINDFFDWEYLKDVIVCHCYMADKADNDFSEIIEASRRLFPQGKNTQDFEQLKRVLLNDIRSNENVFFGKNFYQEFFSLFDNVNDYIQVMDIIRESDTLLSNMNGIVKFSLSLGKEIDDTSLLKREIINFLHISKSSLVDVDVYLEERLENIRKRNGIYTGVDEKTIAGISRKLEKAKGYITRFDSMERKVTGFESLIDSKVKEGTRTIDESLLTAKKEIEDFSSNAVIKMQNDLAKAKEDLLDELKRYLTSLELSLKNSSDKVFEQLVNDTRDKIDQLTVVATNLTETANTEYLRLEKETDGCIKRLQEYIRNNPELKSSLQVVADSEEAMKALLEFNTVQAEAIKVQKESGEKGTSGIIVPQRQIVVPDQRIVTEPDQFMVPNFQMTEGILHAFDKSVPYKDRLARIEEAIAKLEDDGIIIPPALREALPWYIMGKKMVYFYGPTQSGKTTVAELLAKVCGSTMIDGGKITEEHSITGYNDVNGRFDENALYHALYYGLSIFYDELDNGNTDNLVTLGTYSSKLVNKIDNPEKDVRVTFARRRYVPVNVNARFVGAGNTPGKGRNREHTARNRFDESSQERLVHIYVPYSDEVEGKIFGQFTKWHKFFKFFRGSCNEYAQDSRLDCAEGNLTTSDASTIVDCINQQSMDILAIMRGLFVQTKEPDYLSHLIDSVKSEYKVGEVSKKEIDTILNIPLGKLNEKQIAEAFVYEAQDTLNNRKTLAKRQ